MKMMKIKIGLLLLLICSLMGVGIARHDTIHVGGLIDDALAYDPIFSDPFQCPTVFRVDSNVKTVADLINKILQESGIDPKQSYLFGFKRKLSDKGAIDKKLLLDVPEDKVLRESIEFYTYNPQRVERETLHFSLTALDRIEAVLINCQKLQKKADESDEEWFLRKLVGTTSVQWSSDSESLLNPLFTVGGDLISAALYFNFCQEIRDKLHVNCKKRLDDLGQKIKAELNAIGLHHNSELGKRVYTQIAQRFLAFPNPQTLLTNSNKVNTIKNARFIKPILDFVKDAFGELEPAHEQLLKQIDGIVNAATPVESGEKLENEESEKRRVWDCVEKEPKNELLFVDESIDPDNPKETRVNEDELGDKFETFVGMQHPEMQIKGWTDIYPDNEIEDRLRNSKSVGRGPGQITITKAFEQYNLKYKLQGCLIYTCPRYYDYKKLIKWCSKYISLSEKDGIDSMADSYAYIFAQYLGYSPIVDSEKMSSIWQKRLSEVDNELSGYVQKMKAKLQNPTLREKVYVKVREELRIPLITPQKDAVQVVAELDSKKREEFCTKLVRMKEFFEKLNDDDLKLLDELSKPLPNEQAEKEPLGGLQDMMKTLLNKCFPLITYITTHSEEQVDPTFISLIRQCYPDLCTLGTVLAQVHGIVGSVPNLPKELSEGLPTLIGNIKGYDLKIKELCKAFETKYGQKIQLPDLNLPDLNLYEESSTNQTNATSSMTSSNDSPPPPPPGPQDTSHALKLTSTEPSRSNTNATKQSMPEQPAKLDEQPPEPVTNASSTSVSSSTQSREPSKDQSAAHQAIKQTVQSSTTQSTTTPSNASSQVQKPEQGKDQATANQTNTSSVSSSDSSSTTSPSTQNPEPDKNQSTSTANTSSNTANTAPISPDSSTRPQQPPVNPDQSSSNPQTPLAPPLDPQDPPSDEWGIGAKLAIAGTGVAIAAAATYAVLNRTDWGKKKLEEVKKRWAVWRYGQAQVDNRDEANNGAPMIPQENDEEGDKNSKEDAINEICPLEVISPISSQ